MPIYICWYKNASETQDASTQEVRRALWSTKVTQELKMAAKAYLATERPRGWVEVQND